MLGIPIPASPPCVCACLSFVAMNPWTTQALSLAPFSHGPQLRTGRSGDLLQRQEGKEGRSPPGSLLPCRKEMDVAERGLWALHGWMEPCSKNGAATVPSRLPCWLNFSRKERGGGWLGVFYVVGHLVVGFFDEC